MLLATPPAALETALDLRQALLADRARTLTQLYRRTFPAVRQYVQRHGGTSQDAQDVFQDALVLLYEKAVAGTLVLGSGPAAYLAGTCRHLWQRERERRASHPHTELTETHYQACDATELAGELPASFSVRACVEQLGEKCRGMLLGFYYFGQPLAQLAATYGYRSVRSATVQKFKCLERLRDAVRAALTSAS